MLSNKIVDALNQQLNFEFESAHIYLAMAFYCDARNMSGFAHWFQIQAQEEVFHGMKIYRYLNDLGATAKLSSLPEPPSSYDSFEAVFAAALNHEKLVTKKLSDLASLAQEERDQVTYSFLDWFLKEQIEEIANTSSILDNVRLIGDQGEGLYHLNRELGSRPAFNPSGE